MGGAPSSRRHNRIQYNPGMQQHSQAIPPPAGYPATHAIPPPGPAPYPGPASYPGHHMPNYYPPNYNGMMPPVQYFQQGFNPSNGQFLMNGPPSGHRPAGPVPQLVLPSIPDVAEHQKANTIQNDVNLKKATLRLEKDEENPGFHLVAFSFDATVSGSISIFFLAKEGDNCSLTSLKPHIYMPIRVHFEKGLGQKFKQAPGTGVDLSLFDEKELLKEHLEENVFPLVVRTETVPRSPPPDVQSIENESLGAPLPKWIHSQTTQAVIEKKDDGDYRVRVVKQIIWVDGTRYELQEIYGIENSGPSSGFDDSDTGKECVICLSEPRDTTVLPCRHMCMCSDCAKVLRHQTNRCPICRTPVERLLEIKVPKNDSIDT
ncbi:unnamed protein product, partial [Sphagnum jensenii]